MTSRLVEIVVDEVVLHDLTVTDVDAFRAALTEALTERALSDTVPSGRSYTAVEVPPASDAVALGGHVAQAVWHGAR
jgi:hypothetical protein